MATLTLSTGQKARGNPGGTGIYYGTLTVTIANANTTGSTDYTYSKAFVSAPTVVIGQPKWSQTASGATNYIEEIKYSSDATTGFTINAQVDTAPGSYKTVTITIPVTVYGEQYDN